MAQGNSRTFDPATRIRDLRRAAGIPQWKLGALADINPTYVSLIEVRKRVPQPAEVERLAKALSVTPDDLLYLPEQTRATGA